jgi:hypothetical protein
MWHAFWQKACHIVMVMCSLLYEAMDVGGQHPLVYKCDSQTHTWVLHIHGYYKTLCNGCGNANHAHMMNSMIFDITPSTHQALTKSSVAATVLINTYAKSVYRLKTLQAVAA